MSQIEIFQKILKGKTKLINLKVSPVLLQMIDETISSDDEVSSRTELIERCLLKYLEGKVNYK